MSILDMTVEIEGQTFGSFTEAAEAGFPVACEAFAKCDRPADVAVSHPVLDAYPSCNRCAEKLGALA